MVHDPLTWRMKSRCAALASISAAMAFAYLDGSTVHAQSIMRSPSINISSRIPSINPTVTTRVNPNIAGRVVTTGGRTPRISAAAVSAASRIGARSLPYARYSPNLYPACSYAYRDSDGECRDQPLATLDGGGSGPPGQKNQERPARQRLADGGPRPAYDRRRDRGRDRRLADGRTGRRAGAASWPCAAAIAEFPAGRRHHRPVSHYRPPFGRERSPRTSQQRRLSA